MVDMRDPVVSERRGSRRRTRVARQRLEQSLSQDARTTFCVAALSAAVALPALVLGGALPLVTLIGAALTLFAFLLSRREERPAALSWVFVALAGLLPLSAAEPAILAKARAYLAPDAVLDGVKSLHFTGTLVVTGADAASQPPTAMELIFQKPYQQRVQATSAKMVGLTK